MSDGSGGSPKSGVLFELGKTTKAAATKVKNDVTGQVFGATPKASPGGMPANFPKPQPGQKNPFAGMDLSQMFGEKGAGKNPFGPKPVVQQPPKPAISTEELAKMEEERQAKIKAAQEELQAYKQQHNEVYYNQIAQTGQNTQEKQQEKQNAEIKEQNEKQGDLWQKQQKLQKDQQLQAVLKRNLSTGEVGKNVSG